MDGLLTGQMPTHLSALLQFDLLEAPPIKQLAEDEASAPLHQLLMLVINGDVKVTHFCVPACFPLGRSSSSPGLAQQASGGASGMLGD